MKCIFNVVHEERKMSKKEFHVQQACLTKSRIWNDKGTWNDSFKLAKVLFGTVAATICLILFENGTIYDLK